MKRYYKLVILPLFALGLVLSGCERQNSVEPTSSSYGKDISTLTVSDNFNYNTTNDVNVSVYTKVDSKTTLANFPVTVYDGDPNNGGKVIATGQSDANGLFSQTLTVPTAVSKLYVVSNSVGLATVTSMNVSGNAATLDYSNLPTGDTSLNFSKSLAKENTTYKTLGAWDSNGLPKYLMSPRDVIASATLSNISLSLPEGVNLANSANKSYIQNTDSDVKIVGSDSADVYITFVHEGAGYKNVLGFYTYKTGTTITSISQISSSMTIIFPNCSYSGSGGSLTSGDKVYIGRFGPSTTIGFFCLSNGFTGSTTGVGDGVARLFSDSQLNPETDTTLRRHNILMVDPTTGKTILGFEDMRRDQGADNDFNDILFEVTSNPVTAIYQGNMAKLQEAKDSDGDGVIDANDAFPNDPTKAYISYSPSKGVNGSVAFEDLWPGKGDYDFNDLVVDYNYAIITNASNKVVEIDANYQLRAVGASYNSGFGIQMNVSPNVISSVTGTKTSTITLNGNGTESGQSKAVVVVFDAAKSLMTANGGAYVNTEMAYSKVTPVSIPVVIKFSTPQNLSDLGTSPFNPFLIADGVRGREVHLPNNAPTSKADLSILGTADDNSIVASGRYYKTKKNLPWALNIPVQFAYPVEKAAITSAYPNFAVWAESNGASATAWYTNTAANRVASKIYSK
jgi:LruC domain-containing protein